MIGSTLLNQIVGQNMATDPGSVLQKLHLGVQSALQQTQSTGNDKVRDGMELVLCELDLGAQRLRVASANRPFYLIDQGELIEYKGDKVPIGGASAPHSYQNLDISLKKGISLYLFSDGYPDQFGGPDNRKFQTKRFKQLLVDIAALELPAQCERLELELETWRGRTQQVDDVLVMGMRF
jgi:serine phosphatase RsbU (regulator of sigma subunit)